VSFWSGLYRVAVGLLAAAVVAGVVLMFVPKCSRFRELQREQERLRQENVAIEDRIRELRGDRESFATDSAFVERTAREAGMAKPDETVYKFMPAGRRPQHGDNTP
jgi:cell division protein FtsB